MYNSNYVLDGSLGIDILREINNYTAHPIEESRTVRDEALIERLDKIYDDFEKQSKKRINSLYRNKDTCRDYEMSFEINEVIADIYYDLQQISYEGLMRFHPKIKKEELSKHLK